MDGAPGEDPVKLIHYVTLGVWLCGDALGGEGGAGGPPFQCDMSEPLFCRR